ncbi:hypothetical protein PR048_005289 [Dryococelus australis]|uniref:CCHC-type domain-containing protein n=1 Tax=Dryococelus australis TaxID=614101 RepID=A0ABQ9I7S8_9NEOP|nr:hypothetical protein PR048_005289 [Dryococelus australis]
MGPGKLNEAMSRYLGRVDAILDNLKCLGADVNKSMVITKIISSPHEHFILAWESMPSEWRKMDELTFQLLVEQQRFKARIEEGGSTSSTAFKMVKAGRKCFSCGKVEHYKQECKSNIKKSDNANNNKFQITINKGVKYCQQCKQSVLNLNECWFRNKSSGPITSNAFQVYVMPAINSEYASDE